MINKTCAHRAAVPVMLGVDTNVLVRYLTRDDQPRYEKARRLIDREVTKGDPVLVSLVVLLETIRCRATATFDDKALKLAEFISV